MLKDQRGCKEEQWRRFWNVDRIRLMCKDASTLFVYWEVSSLRKQIISEHFESRWDQLPFYLLLHDVTDMLFEKNVPHSTQVIAVQPDSENWYIHPVLANRSYLIQLCTATKEGEFFSILQSNSVTTPRVASVSDQPSVCFRRPIRQERTVQENAISDIGPYSFPYFGEFDGYTVNFASRGCIHE